MPVFRAGFGGKGCVYRGLHKGHLCGDGAGLVGYPVDCRDGPVNGHL